MVLSLSNNVPAGSLSTRALTNPSPFSTTSSSSKTSSSMDSSSSNHFGSSHSFGAILSAKMFSQKLMARRLSSDKNGGDGSNNNTIMRRLPFTSGATAATTAPILTNPQEHLQELLTSETAPFLSQYLDQPIPAKGLERNALHVGKLLHDGDLTRLYHVNGFKSRNPQQRQHPYVVKFLHPRLLQQSSPSQRSLDASGRTASDEVVDHTRHHHVIEEDEELEAELEKAATKLVLEGLYLAHLSHPHILKLRGVAAGGIAALQTTSGLFLLTDRLGDTLDQRMDTWKQWAAAREKEERKRRQPKKYPAPLVPPTSSTKEGILQDPIIQTYPEDLIVLKTNYALQILDALQYLHERGIVVRELRPDSIGFCAYPHHHTVQLCDLSSCKEVPRDGSRITPEVLEQRPSLLDGSSHHHHSSNTTMDNSQSSYHTTASSQEDDDNSHTNGSMDASALLGVRTTITARRYMAPEVFREQGYNTKADLYSWAMVFSEMVTEAKPYSSRQLVRDWTKIVRGELRPKLQKYHFPRTIKAILEQAWQANTVRRATAKQVSKSLTTVLHMLEGQGLPWLIHESRQQQQQQATLSRRQMMSRQKTLPRQSITLQSAVVQRHSALRCATTDEPLTLPQRAAHYKRLQAEQPQGWGNVWDPKAAAAAARNAADVEAEKVTETTKDQVFEKRLKANPLRGL